MGQKIHPYGLRLGIVTSGLSNGNGSGSRERHRLANPNIHSSGNRGSHGHEHAAAHLDPGA